MPKGDSQDGFFHPILTVMMESYTPPQLDVSKLKRTTSNIPQAGTVFSEFFMIASRLSKRPDGFKTNI